MVEESVLFDALRSNEKVVDFFDTVELQPGERLQLRLETDRLRLARKPRNGLPKHRLFDAFPNAQGSPIERGTVIIRTGLAMNRTAAVCSLLVVLMPWLAASATALMETTALPARQGLRALGQDGADGLDGVDGLKADGANGADGADGADGSNGTDGLDGKSTLFDLHRVPGEVCAVVALVFRCIDDNGDDSWPR